MKNEIPNQEAIDSIVGQIIAIKPTGIVNKPLSIERAQYLLDWLKAGNEESRKNLGLEAGGEIDRKTQAAEDLLRNTLHK